LGTSINVKGRITKVGDPDVRRALSLMKLRLRCSPVHGLRHDQDRGLKLAKTKCHAKARVAVARKLAIVMHAMWRDGTIYVGDPDATEQETDSWNAAKVQRLSYANS
jgi:transposase